MIVLSIYMDIKQVDYTKYFPQLKEIPEPPKELYVRGNLHKSTTKLLAVVGSRKYSNYGQQVCESLISGLRGYNIAIISGLALGMDTIAHKSALDVGLQTFAFPGSGLRREVLYPRGNVQLAEDIIKGGGALVSEFEPSFRATRWSFPKRNRLMAGVSDAVLIIEAEEKSGTRITARLATEYNRELGVVPGSIFSQSSEGTNSLLKLGATPVTSSDDILEMLNIQKIEQCSGTLNLDCTKQELELLNELSEPLTRNDLALKLNIKLQELGMVITVMEIKGLIKERLGKVFKK